MDALAWSKHVAELGVDALLDHGLVRKEDFDLKYAADGRGRLS
jgi:hypothetical protein